jgi:hypothetical protein
MTTPHDNLRRPAENLNDGSLEDTSRAGGCRRAEPSQSESAPPNGGRRRRTAGNGFQFLPAFFVLLLFATALSGCSATRPILGVISVTNPTGTPAGQVSSVVVNSSVDISVAVNGDRAGLGVDWNLLCGGSAVTTANPNPCGTITPVHVGSNVNMVYLAPPYIPVANTVTLTAIATGDPSQSASVTLTILPAPVTIQFTQGFLPPSAIAAGGTARLAATVSNDPTYAGVQWSVSCGSSSCGSFNPTATASAGGGFAGTTVYTAPAAVPSGGTVTVTASSIYSSQSVVSSEIQVMPISVTATVSQNPVFVGGSATLTATVSWDVAEQGVNWSAPQCAASACGAVTPGSCVVNGPTSQTTTVCTAIYAAPSPLPAGTTSLAISETATSVTDPTKAATANFAVAPPPPISVLLTATPNAVQAGGSTTLAATVSYDFSDSGVAWQCSPACDLSNTTTPSSTTNSSATYTTNYNPAGPVPAGDASMPVVVTATSIAAAASDPTGSASTAITVYQPISVTVNPPSGPITGGVPATFSATVTNDIGSAGVVWSASGCPPGVTPCGTFSQNHSTSGASVTYTLQPIQWATSTPSVTITATSIASQSIPPLSSGSVTDTVVPVAFVQFIPFAPSTLPVGNSTASSPTLISLVASTANDSTNQGVDWTVSCPDASAAACGQFMESPALAPTAANSAGTPIAFRPYGQTVHAANGQAVVYEPPTQNPTGGTVTLTATSTGNPTASPATQTVTITSNLSGPALTGTVQAGNLPVSGATVELFSAGNTGYGSAATPLVISSGGGNAVTTGSNGSFAIPAGYTCPSLNSLVYLVAIGGTPQGQATPNAQLGLMTALGPCSDLNSSVPLVVNEVTTVASVFALAPFMPSTGGDYTTIGASNSNYNNGPNPSNATNFNNGLANAFATVNNLVDITKGQALLITRAGDGTVPQAEINTLADAIDTCAASAGGAPGDGSACAAFFEASNVNPVGGGESTTSNAPTTILQAIIEVAQVPSTERTESTTSDASGLALYSLAANPSFNAPFLPMLTASPYDWSIALSYSGGGLEGKGGARPDSSALALDAAGNVWISNKNISSVTEFSNAGAPLSPFATGTTKAAGGGFTGGGLITPLGIAVDTYGDVWALNNNSSLSELALNGASLSSASGISGAGNASDTGAGIAIDGIGNVWVADAGSPGDLAEYAGYFGVQAGEQTCTGTTACPAGTALSPQGTGYVDGINSPNGAIAVDGSDNIWLLNGGNYAAVELSSANGQLLDTDEGDLVNGQTGLPDNPPQYLLNSSNFGTSIALDHAGDIFILGPIGGAGEFIYELLAGASASSFGGTAQQVAVSLLEAGSAPVQLYPSLAIDGSGHFWGAVTAVTTGDFPLPLALGEWSSSGGAINENYLAQGFVASSMSSNNLSTVAIDASGNVWVLSGNATTTATEFVGVAAPVVTPFSLAVQKNKLGSKP